MKSNEPNEKKTKEKPGKKRQKKDLIWRVTKKKFWREFNLADDEKIKFWREFNLADRKKN